MAVVPNKKPSMPIARKADPRQGEPQVMRSADEAVATVLAREAYTRERHYFLTRICMGLLLAVCLQSAGLLYMATRPPVNHYFTTNRDGRIQEMTPVSKPISSLTDLTTWVANSVIQAYTMDFANYRSQMSAAQFNFTPDGWKSFMAALDDAGILKTIIANKYVTTAVPTSAPIMVDQGNINGRYAWKLQMPMLVTYQSSEKTYSQPLSVDIIVVRQPETEHPRGLGIAQLLAHS